MVQGLLIVTSFSTWSGSGHRLERYWLVSCFLWSDPSTSFLVIHVVVVRRGLNAVPSCQLIPHYCGLHGHPSGDALLSSSQWLGLLQAPSLCPYSWLDLVGSVWATMEACAFPWCGGSADVWWMPNQCNWAYFTLDFHLVLSTSFIKLSYI